ncbi:MAG TPA: tetratricopeptide repeat protein [Pirellulales bacterium]|jgi:tetratricopeptide (TPR) repeat protein/CHAT domain-containing protein|nr:tetratricopeptide repeat protein [Pirellulales bacterium]
MSPRTRRACLWAAVFALVLSGRSAARGAEVDELLRLQKQVQDLQAAGRSREALPAAQQLVTRAERLFANRPDQLAYAINELAGVCWELARNAEAETLYKRSLGLFERARGADDPDAAIAANNLGLIYWNMGRYADAEKFFKRAIASGEKRLGAEHPDVAMRYNNLALVYQDLGRYAEAEKLFKRAIASGEKRLAIDHPDVATRHNNLALLYHQQGRYAEAEPLFKRAIASGELRLATDHPVLATRYSNLGLLYMDQGRYSEAETLFKRAIAIGERKLGADHPDVATRYSNLGLLYYNERRYPEAEALDRKAIAVGEKALGTWHPHLAVRYNNLGLVCQRLGRRDEAEKQFNRAIAIAERNFGPQHPTLMLCLNNLADLTYEKEQFAEAEKLYRRVLDIREKTLGAGHPDVGWSQFSLANACQRDGRIDDALRYASRALEIHNKAQISPAGRFQDYFLLAKLAWTQNRRDSALENLRQSLVLAEQQRGLVSGGDLERATVFGTFAGAYEQMAIWQRELNNVDEVFRATEGRRGRAELDQLTGENDRRPASAPATLAAIQERIAGSDRLVLEYLIGDAVGLVVVIPPLGQPPRVEPLTVDEHQAKRLGIKPGWLTSEALRKTLADENEGGVLQLLRKTSDAARANEKLAALWETLVPPPERATLLSGQLKQLIVIPDGPLAMLPFDALVVSAGETPSYLLDQGPTLLAALSATALVNVIDAPGVAGTKDLKPVLSVSNPNYPPTKSGATKPVQPSLDVQSRYVSLGGSTKPLPSASTEASWVTAMFTRQEIPVGSLSKEKATEAAVRHNIPGRRVVHLACRGLAGQANNEAFGALALTPGPQPGKNAADDGFLTLAEIYALDLKGCEVVILSGSESKLGPNQKGEGAWSLARGFLAAGSRRVLLSNGSVDDEATASLISVFCDRVAQGQKGGDLDYGEALQYAKRWMRKQDKWKQPCYWGQLVLAGAN